MSGPALDYMRDRLARLGLDPTRISAGDLAQIVELDAAAPMDAASLLLAAGAVYRAEPTTRPWPAELP